MKIQSKILLITSFSLLLNACGQQHQNEEDHLAPANEHAQRQKEEHAHAENSNIAELTQEQINAVGITYGEVEMKELTATIRANGNLRVPNNRKANATSLYGGTIKSINIQVGDLVRKGQVIATMTNPQFVQLQEEYLTAVNQLVFAKQEYNRQKELFDNNAGTKKNLQNAQAELGTLQAKKASLQKQLQLMGIKASNISNATLRTQLAITAPINGTISKVIAQIGSYIDVSLPLAEIVDNASLHLDLDVFEKDLPRLKVGQTIHFTLTNNPTNEYDAEVFSIGAAFENESKTIPVHAKVKGNKTGLIDGMNITGVVSLHNVLTPAVPNDALVNADGKYFIFIITNKTTDHEKESKADEHTKDKTSKNVNFEKIEVSVGVSDMGYTAIVPIGNLPRGAKLVTKGAFFINAKLSNTQTHDH